jgi:hypothetical protein
MRLRAILTIGKRIAAALRDGRTGSQNAGNGR